VTNPGIPESDLLTTAEVARRLRCSERTLRRLPLAFLRRRDRGARLYKAADVEAYIERQRECPSTVARTLRTGTVKSKSLVVGLSEALARPVGETPRRSKPTSGANSKPKQSAPAERT